MRYLRMPPCVRMRQDMRYHLSSFIGIALLFIAISTARAGNGPQNVLVVVNAASAESLEIGNAYRRARNIPYRQLLTIQTATSYAIPYQSYLEDIETPIRTYLKAQQLEEEVTCIVLTRGVPQQVLIENGRSTASLLATMNISKESKLAYARWPNPYYNMSLAFSHRPPKLRGMYLVTVLNGYDTRDVAHMIEQGVAADGTAPDGRFLLQTSSNFSPSAYATLSDMLAVRTLTAEVVTAPPATAAGLMGYFSGGIYSGLIPEMVTACTFRPGAIVDFAQSFSAAANNFDESAPPILLPLAAYVRAGVSGAHGVVGEAGINTFPLTANAKSLLEHYTSGFSLAESFYTALPALNWQNIVLGDPLCTPYAQRPIVTFDPTPGQLLKDITHIHVTAASQTRGGTISRLDVYLDDRFIQTIYQPELTRISLTIGKHTLTYEMPRNSTLRLLLEGFADAINANPEFAGPDGVRALVSMNTSSIQLLARTPGAEGNDTPVAITVSPGDEHNAPQVTARMEQNVLSGGGLAPTPAHATLSFIARHIKAGDQVTLQILKEKLSYTVPDDKTSLSDLLDALVNLVNTFPGLSTNKGVHASRDAHGMPYLTLEARSPGEVGNAISFQLTVQPVEGSHLRAYPDTPSYLSGGQGGSAANLTIQFALGESTVHATYLFKTGELSDGYHRLRVVAVDGSPAQVQGIGDNILNRQNNPTPPVVTLPEKIGPAFGQATIPVAAQANVKHVDLFVDGQLLASGNTAPYNLHISLATLGRGMHDLWAEGADVDGNHFVTAPVPLEVLVASEVSRITPDHAALAGATTHRVVGNGFQPGCTVTLAGIPARTVKFLTPNLLEVVSNAGPAHAGPVQVTNPDHTISALSARFEYYQPTVARIAILPACDVIAPGVKAQFTAHCYDQFDSPIAAPVHWEATTGIITAAGIFTAPKTAGKCLLHVTQPESKQSSEAALTIGPDMVRDGRLQQWLIAGPFSDADHTGFETPLLAETTLAPSHDNPAREFTWRSVHSTKDYIDMTAHFGPNCNNVLAYAHLYLYAPAPTVCSLVFGSDDGIRLWLNGDPIFSLRTHRQAYPNQNTQRIILNQGWNRLLVKNDQMSGPWGFYMRLLSPDGKPLSGILYQLDKPGKE